MNIRPLYDRIVVKRIDEQETTRNGIVIPDSARRSLRRAKSSLSVTGNESRMAASLPSM